MKILIVGPYVPHPQAGHGSAVFMYGLLEQITGRHQVTWLSFCGKDEQHLIADLRRLPIEFIPVPRGRGARKNPLWNIYLSSVRLLQMFRSVLLWQPYFVGKFYHPRMKRLVRKLTAAGNYDIVQCDASQMGQYIAFVKSGKTILHEHDLVFRPAYRRYKNAKFFLARFFSSVEFCRWTLYEKKMFRLFDHIMTVTEQDAALVRRLSGRKNVSHFRSAIALPPVLPPYLQRTPNSILFVGSFAHQPNADSAMWLVSEIFPLILKECPDATLEIVGARPPDALKSLAEQYRGITVRGFVDDVDAYFQSCRVFIAPLRYGGGIKIKNLHAMANGIPVVTTKVGIEGIEGVSPENMLVADSPGKIASTVVSLLADPQRAERIGMNGREAVGEWYSWERTTAQLEEIYKRVLNPG